jgi:hypothetical protein
MRKSKTVLAILTVALVAATVANAEMTEEEKAMFKRLEQRVAAQDKKIAQLQGTLSDESRQKARHEEIRQVLKELNADLDQRAAPGWLENFKIYGDLRLRYHFAHYNRRNEDRPSDSRGRFRLRVGGQKTWLEKQLEVGFRFATGSSDDPTSTNQTFTNNFSEKNLWVDLAYAKYQPKWLKGFTAVGGKMKNPFVNTNMIWDSDVNPEGVWAVCKYGGLGPVEPFAGFGFFQLDNNTRDPDATMHAYQTGLTWKIAKDLKWTSALAYYDYGNYEEYYSRAKHNSEWDGRLTAEEFNILNLTNKVGWKAFGLPMSAFVDYAHNCGNDAGGQSDALAVGCKVGKNKKKGDWSASYKYAYIQQNATVAAFNDSDFGNTNRKGHVWGVKYNILDPLTAGVNLFYTQPVSGDSTGETEFLMLADLIWKF